MTKSNGVTIYEGPSQINGQPIVAILTGIDHPTTNSVTGDMLQLWILAADVPPLEASQTGADAAVCGGCKRRSIYQNSESCYVLLFQAPRGIWATWKNGDYPATDDVAPWVENAMVRLGAYGDPAALPRALIRALVDASDGHTGYTHSWASKRFQWLRDYVQASVDTIPEYERAAAMGWGTFRVSDDGATLDSEVQCPAKLKTTTSKNSRRRKTCDRCQACNGTGRQITTQAT